MQGWECPKCGRCYAPSVTQCAVCGQNGGAGVTVSPFQPFPTPLTGSGKLTVDPKVPWQIWYCGSWIPSTGAMSLTLQDASTAGPIEHLRLGRKVS